MDTEEATTTEQIGVADITPPTEAESSTEGTQQSTTLPPSPQEQFLSSIHDRLMMAHALVTFSILRTDDTGTILKLTDKDLARARYAAGVLVYGDDTDQFTYAGDGVDGVEADSLACAMVRCRSFPARS
jgi:hypothetical protein